MTDLVERAPIICEAITEAFGERCGDFEPDCWACKAWAELDSLTAALSHADHGGVKEDALGEIRRQAEAHKRSTAYNDGVNIALSNIEAIAARAMERTSIPSKAAKTQSEAPVAKDAYMRLISLFDQDATAGSFLREDGEGGFVGGVERMAREIDRLRDLTRAPALTTTEGTTND